MKKIFTKFLKKYMKQKEIEDLKICIEKLDGKVILLVSLVSILLTLQVIHYLQIWNKI